MFKSEELVYIQMQKTGCTHIASLLTRLFDGEIIGKHNAAKPDDFARKPLFVSSIRNPWDWYLSLWTFGAQGKGGLWERLTGDHRKMALKDALRSPTRNFGALLGELGKDAAAWQDAYDATDQLSSFRTWLKRVHDPRNDRVLGEGYDKAALADVCGFMTYRYLALCCRGTRGLGRQRRITDFDDLSRFDRESCYIDYFIRQEALEEMLCEAVEKIRPLTGEERQMIFGAGKTNTSRRSLTLTDYYDRESIELVADRDRLLIEKFGYAPPGP